MKKAGGFGKYLLVTGAAAAGMALVALADGPSTGMGGASAKTGTIDASGASSSGEWVHSGVFKVESTEDMCDFKVSIPGTDGGISDVQVYAGKTATAAATPTGADPEKQSNHKDNYKVDDNDPPDNKVGANEDNDTSAHPDNNNQHTICNDDNCIKKGEFFSIRVKVAHSDNVQVTIQGTSRGKAKGEGGDLIGLLWNPSGPGGTYLASATGGCGIRGACVDGINDSGLPMTGIHFSPMPGAAPIDTVYSGLAENPIVGVYNPITQVYTFVDPIPPGGEFGVNVELIDIPENQEVFIECTAQY
jgi:hypothetical protein